MARAPFSFLRVNPALPIADLRARFARDRRVAVVDFLEPDCAHALATHLAARNDWRMMFNSGAKTYELARADRLQMAPADWNKLVNAVDEAGRYTFQYRYEAIRIDDEAVDRERSGSLIDEFAILMSSSGTLSLVRQIIGDVEIVFADAQATCYTAGDFLTAHDDVVAGKGRRAAYVYGLTQIWRPEWGGLLLFHGADGQIDGGFVPGFNTLHLFAVPTVHSVTSVASLAGAERLSITGWLRDLRPSG